MLTRVWDESWKHDCYKEGMHTKQIARAKTAYRNSALTFTVDLNCTSN